MIEDKDAKTSYALGMNVASSILQQGLHIGNTDLFVAGIKDTLNGNPPQINPEEANELIMAEAERLQNERKAANEKNSQIGKDFLIKNGKRDEITVLPSGLQYEVLKEGDGEKPSFTSKVTTHYHGTLVNGEVFDSSVTRGTPATFGVDQVIKGWTEALQLMKTGSKWKLYIPGDLAYGDRGAGDKIGPDETLIFEVELLAIN